MLPDSLTVKIPNELAEVATGPVLRKRYADKSESEFASLDTTYALQIRHVVPGQGKNGALRRTYLTFQEKHGYVHPVTGLTLVGFIRTRVAVELPQDMFNALEEPTLLVKDHASLVSGLLWSGNSGMNITELLANAEY